MNVESLMFTIHDRPSDFPEEVVITVVNIADTQRPPGHPIPMAMRWTFRTVEEARTFIRTAKPEAACFPRDPEDPPHIVESWF